MTQSTKREQSDRAEVDPEGGKIATKKSAETWQGYGQDKFQISPKICFWFYYNVIQIRIIRIRIIYKTPIYIIIIVDVLIVV